MHILSVVKPMFEKIRKLRHHHLILLLVDASLFGIVFLFEMLALQIAGYRPFQNFALYFCTAAILAVFIFLARFLGKCYSNIMRYANSQVYLFLVIMDFCGGGLATVLNSFLLSPKHLYMGTWESLSLVAVFDISCLCVRFFYQALYHAFKTTSNREIRITVAIVGAGQVGTMLAQDLLLETSSHYRPVCLVDKDPAKVGGRALGLPILDSEDASVLENLNKFGVQEIFIALPKLTQLQSNEIIRFYSQTGCKVKFFGLPSDDAEKGKIREIKIEDLLFRQTQKVMTPEGMEFYRGKTVLVTGGGGSIGSEICRQIAKLSPKKLIVFDIYENNAYDLQQDMIRRYGKDLNLAVEIGSVRDRDRLEAVFAYYRPDVVFHAAAHKHVPLMEHSNCEAIKNNVFGTFNSADMAEKYGVRKFILISTDKAVNPTNIMGASKRMCEMVIQCRQDSQTTFAAVRFGNVLGSNGSVIPLFRRQIEEGGPLTVTDKRIIRYFMTIPEASKLVMQAGAMAKHGELFVLDMGNPVRIIDLAENMIRLSGLKPYEDIQIVETGLRPGEKLYEELLIKSETLSKTESKMIFIERDQPLTRQAVNEKLEALKTAVEQEKGQIASPAVEKAMKAAVPTFRSPDEVNREAANAEEMKLVH